MTDTEYGPRTAQVRAVLAQARDAGPLTLALAGAAWSAARDAVLAEVVGDLISPTDWGLLTAPWGTALRTREALRAAGPGAEAIASAALAAGWHGTLAELVETVGAIAATPPVPLPVEGPRERKINDAFAASLAETVAATVI